MLYDANSVDVPTLNVESVRNDFPFLNHHIGGKPIVYFDNAATTQKPKQVIDAIVDYYQSSCGNVFRANHALARESTQKYEAARCKVARFINADEDEIVFTKNTSDGINLVCNGLSRPGTILTSLAEHHSNLVPWMNGRSSEMIDVDSTGVINLSRFSGSLNSKVALIACSHVSNVLSFANPIEEIIQQAKKHDVLTLVDAAQSVPHMKLDVKKLDCDFLAFSGHKMLAPTGIGVLYIKKESRDSINPIFFGGNSVQNVNDKGFSLLQAPRCYEVGTPNIEGAIALAAAIEYLEGIGIDSVFRHVQELVEHGLSRLRTVKNCRLFERNNETLPVSAITFQLSGIAPHVVAKTLDARDNVMIRSGFHCAQPFHDLLGGGPTARSSFSIYNTTDEIDIMCDRIASLAEFI